MAFNGDNMTPVGGNARSGDNAQGKNSPMAWAYLSTVDSLSDIQATGYFDTFNSYLQVGQFIYVSATDAVFFVFIASVDTTLKQVVLDPVPLVPIKIPKNVEGVLIPADFGEPDAGVVTLATNKLFTIFDNVSMTDRIVLPAGFPISNINGTNLGINNLMYEGDDTFITGIGIRAFLTDRLGYIYTGVGNATCFDLDAEAFIDSSALSFDAGFLLDWPDIGTFKNFNLLDIETISITGCGPVTFENIFRLNLTDFFIKPTPAQTGLTLINITGDNDVFGSFVSSKVVINSGQSVIFVDPNIGVNSMVTLGNINIDNQGGEFFKTGVTGDINLWADNPQSGNVNLIEDNGDGQILVTLTAPHNLFPFMEVTLNVGVTNYDVPVNITSTGPGASQFVLPIAFEGDASGTFDTNSVTVTTTAPHNQGDGQTLLIATTISYNGGAKIYNASGTAFSLNREFVAAEIVGTFNTGSLTQTDPRLIVSAVQGVPDSQTRFNLLTLGNTALTTFTVNDQFEPVNLDLPATISTEGTELFNLVNPTAGIFEYIGTEEIVLIFGGSSVIDSVTNSSRTYTFILAINGAVSTTNLPISLTISNSPGAFNFAGLVSLVPGDTVQMFVSVNDVSSSDLEITDFSFYGKV